MRIAIFFEEETNKPKTFFQRVLAKFRQQSEKLGSDAILFTISPNTLSFNEIPHSAFASPARYLMETFIRVRSMDAVPDDCLLFNPFFLVSAASARSVEDSVREIGADAQISIVSDRNGMPLAYYIPKDFPANNARLFSLLSCMDASLDAQFLEASGFGRVLVTRINSLSLNKKRGGNNFNYTDSLEAIYRWITQMAVLTIKRQGRNDIAGIPYAGFMPHHAGDVLFLAKALEMTESPVKAVIVNGLYRDILDEMMPDIDLIPFTATPMLRDGLTKPDDEYFLDIVPNLPETALTDYFHYYLRPSREYRICDFHLIDQFAFALGASPRSEEELLSRRPVKNLGPVERVNLPVRVLLHFEGGWPLKVYPEEFQKGLVSLLREKGYEISILTARTDYGDDIHTEKYASLARFRELLSSQHLFIGMDSFPVHYAAYVAGVPSICLFSSTKPVNSHAPLSDNYRYLNKGLGCDGCFGFDVCPINGERKCGNFSSPQLVFDAAEEILSLMKCTDGKLAEI